MISNGKIRPSAKRLTFKLPRKAHNVDLPLSDSYSKGDKPICLNPVRVDRQYVRCRQCTLCQSHRVNGWTLRAIMESELAGEIWTWTGTYRDGEAGAVEERYEDVQAMLRKMRKAGYRFRFIAVGEQGKRGTQRHHWHGVFFFKRQPDACLPLSKPYSRPAPPGSARVVGGRIEGAAPQVVRCRCQLLQDERTAGGDQRAKQAPSCWRRSDPRAIWGAPPKGPLATNEAGKVIRGSGGHDLHAFPFWPHGYSTIDPAFHAGAVQYVVKYITKDLGGGKFAMSLKPGIASDWIEADAKEYARLGLVRPVNAFTVGQRNAALEAQPHKAAMARTVREGTAVKYALPLLYWRRWQTAFLDECERLGRRVLLHDFEAWDDALSTREATIKYAVENWPAVAQASRARAVSISHNGVRPQAGLLAATPRGLALVIGSDHGAGLPAGLGSFSDGDSLTASQIRETSNPALLLPEGVYLLEPSQARQVMRGHRPSLSYRVVSMEWRHLPGYLQRASLERLREAAGVGKSPGTIPLSRRHYFAADAPAAHRRAVKLRRLLFT